MLWRSSDVVVHMVPHATGCVDLPKIPRFALASETNKRDMSQRPSKGSWVARALAEGAGQYLSLARSVGNS